MRVSRVGRHAWRNGCNLTDTMLREIDMDSHKAGSCNCKSVRFTTSGPLRGVVYCHCSQCRKQSGHYYAATSVETGFLDIQGEEYITWYAASLHAVRGFCSKCGSNLFWKVTNGTHVSILAGAFEQPSGLHGLCHIFVADKGDYYTLDDDLPKFEQNRASS